MVVGLQRELIMEPSLAFAVQRTQSEDRFGWSDIVKKGSRQSHSERQLNQRLPRSQRKIETPVQLDRLADRLLFNL